MSSTKVAPTDPATGDVDEIHAEMSLRNNFFEEPPGGCDIRKTIKYTHMREASKEGFFEWFVLRLPAPLIVINKPLAMH